MNGGLSGKRIVNTRAEHQAKALNDLLQLRGAVPEAYPCIEIIPPEDTSQLDKALVNLCEGHYDWLTLTSANTVFALKQRLDSLGLTLAGKSFRTAVIGPATAEAAQQLGLNTIDLPAQYDAEALAISLPIEAGTRVLLPESVIARPTLNDQLTTRGAKVTVVTAYQTICGRGGVDVPRLLAQKQIDAMTFTSSSTVTYFLERLQKEGGKLEDALSLCAACIGDQTAQTARDCDFRVITVASEHTLDGLVNTLDRYFVQTSEVGKPL
ncbi:MAG: uroporphyrinogen-III synthase [Anaerolineaceae bacterium]|nr:uroporphyrinogen-III synthase [Anaerolineaceae bacterium]